MGRRPRRWKRAAVLAPLLLLLGGLVARAIPIVAKPKQTFATFATPTPLPQGSVLIIGFLGGWEKWDDAHRGVRKFALRLREKNLPGVYVETVENHHRELAVELVKRALDRNHDGVLDDNERRSARVILFGQSFGGAAVNKCSRELEALGVPVLLSVQVDSVGRDAGLVPANVRRAVNFYQKNDAFFIRGEDDFRAADPRKTEILGNFRWNYSGKNVDLSDGHWYQKVFHNAHVKMEQDPELWDAVEPYILREIETLRRQDQSVAHGQR